MFLGLAKHTSQTWKDVGVLQDKHFNLLQEKVDCIVPPSIIGRIPRKIQGFLHLLRMSGRIGFCTVLFLPCTALLGKYTINAGFALLIVVGYYDSLL